MKYDLEFWVGVMFFFTLVHSVMYLYSCILKKQCFGGIMFFISTLASFISVLGVTYIVIDKVIV
jgi:hypothetical protein